MVSAGAGGFLSTLIGPEAGAAAGQALIEATDRFIDFLSGRAKARVEAVVDSARAEGERRLMAGETARADGLLDADSAAGREILESVLRAAIETEEQRKCHAVGNLAAAVGYEEDVSAPDALRYLRALRSLSWRQLRMLAFVMDGSRRGQLEKIAFRGEEGDAQIHPALEVELSEAARRYEVLGFRQDDGGVSNPSNNWGTGQVVAASLAKLAATGFGETIHRLARLDSVVTEAELDELYVELGGVADPEEW